MFSPEDNPDTVQRNCQLARRDNAPKVQNVARGVAQCSLDKPDTVQRNCLLARDTAPRYTVDKAQIKSETVQQQFEIISSDSSLFCIAGFNAGRDTSLPQYSQRIDISSGFSFDDDVVDNDNYHSDDEGGVSLHLLGDDPPGRKGGRF